MSLCCTADDAAESSHEGGLSPSPMLLTTAQLVSVGCVAVSEDNKRSFLEPMIPMTSLF